MQVAQLYFLIGGKEKEKYSYWFEVIIFSVMVFECSKQWEAK